MNEQLQQAIERVHILLELLNKKDQYYGFEREGKMRLELEHLLEVLRYAKLDFEHFSMEDGRNNELKQHSRFTKYNLLISVIPSVLGVLLLIYVFIEMNFNDDNGGKNMNAIEMLQEKIDSSYAQLSLVNDTLYGDDNPNRPLNDTLELILENKREYLLFYIRKLERQLRNLDRESGTDKTAN